MPGNCLGQYTFKNEANNFRNQSLSKNNMKDENKAGSIFQSSG